MNKKELAQSVAAKCDITSAAAESAIDAVFASIIAEMKSGGDVVVREFGTFKSDKRAARTGRNPSTGATIQIAEKMVPKFTASKPLKDAIAG